MSPYITIIRPVNSAMVGLAVIVGAAVALPSAALSTQAIAGFLTGFLISSYSMVVNDIFDLEADRINSPGRVLPRELISLGSAKVYGVILLLLGLAFAGLTSILHFAIAAIFAGVSLVYNHSGKRYGLLGNGLVALSITIPYVYGAALSGAIGRFSQAGLGDPLIQFLSLTTFLAAMGREVIKGITDVEGDEVRGVRTVATEHGRRAAAILGSLLLLVSVASSWAPVVLGVVGLYYAVLVAIPGAILVYVSAGVMMAPTPENAYAGKKRILIAMLLGLLAFIVGGVLRR